MKQSILIALLTICLLTLNAAADPPTTPPPTTQPFFPIMAWSGAPNDPAALKTMRDCGITVVGPTGAEHLDACQAAGLKVIVSDSRTTAGGDEAAVKKNIDSLVAQTGKHPALLGYFVTDEPAASAYPALAAVSKAIHAAAPDKIPYINLFPNYATTDQLGAKSYDDYLEQFCTTCSPSIISYDHYALLDDGTLRDGYYQNLEAVRRASMKHNIPFWNIVLSVGHLTYRIPTLADFEFQAYTTLACGGRGLVYFMYINPAVGNYRQAPIDQFGHQTDTWFHMQNVNLQVLNLAPTMLRLHSDDVYHIGQLPHDCHGASPTTLVKTVPGGDFLVGDFTHEDGTRYVLIVNKDLKKSHPCFPEFNKPVKQTTVILPWGENASAVFQDEQAWLAPGAGALLKLQ